MTRPAPRRLDVSLWPGPGTTVPSGQGVIPAGIKFGKSWAKALIRGLAFRDWNRFSPWLPAYRTSTAEFLLSSRSKPKLQLWTLSGPKSGAMEVSAKLRGSNTPLVMEGERDARTFGPVGTAGNGCVVGFGSVCKHT